MALTGRHDFENCICWLPTNETNYFGFPEIHGIQELPEDSFFINSEFARKKPDYDSWVMFYEYDYKFERVWEQPKRYATWLTRFRGAITPNFSVYQNIPNAISIMSIYRARWCGAYWESLGIPVIPDVSWGNASTLDWAFDGLPTQSVVSVNDVGNHKHPNDETRKVWLNGFNKMLLTLNPSLVLIYGAIQDDLPKEAPLMRINALTNHRNILGD